MPLVTLSERNTISDPSFYSLYDNGVEEVFTRYWRKKLPTGDFVVLMAPVRRQEDGGTRDGDAQVAVAVARGVLMAFAGHSAADQLVFRQMPTFGSLDHTTRSTGPIEVFASPDQFAFVRPESLSVLMNRLSHHISPEHRRRYVAAFTFLGRATAKWTQPYVSAICGLRLRWSLAVMARSRRWLEELTSTDGPRRKLREIKGSASSIIS